VASFLGIETVWFFRESFAKLLYNFGVKILIFGAKGYIGRLFLSAYPGAVCPDADIADPEAVSEALDAHHPDIVINCAGKTGRPNVDWCEDHKEETLRSNVTGPLVLLDACGKRGIYWAHIGSGCIYEGDAKHPFTEQDPPNFTGSFYSKTKAWSDQILQNFPVLLLRIRMPFDATKDPRNLLMKISKYQRVLDVENSLTYLPDFLSAAKTLIAMRKVGPYNIVNRGTISPYRIMEMYKQTVDPSCSFTRLTVEDLKNVTKAPRSNCVLSTLKLEREGIPIRPVEDAVSEALKALKTQ